MLVEESVYRCSPAKYGLLDVQSEGGERASASKFDSVQVDVIGCIVPFCDSSMLQTVMKHRITARVEQSNDFEGRQSRGYVRQDFQGQVEQGGMPLRRFASSKVLIFHRKLMAARGKYDASGGSVRGALIFSI